MDEKIPEESKGLIESLKNKIYKRGTFRADISRSEFSQSHNEPREDWRPEDDQMYKGLLSPKFLKKFFLFALVFFLLALSASAYIIWSGSNVVQANNLEITLKGPTSIKGGEELNLGIGIENNNSTSLEFVDLIVTYPTGTREAGNLEKELPRYRKNLGTINKGEIVNENVKAVLFGEAGKEAQIKIALEYRTAGSNAIFEKEKTYTVLLSSSPLDVNLSIPEELNAGNQIDFVIDVSAPSESALSNILIRADYPSGFKFKESSPRPIFGTNVWSAGDMQGGTTRRIRVSGVLEGQDGEKKLFRVTAGVAAEGKDSVIGVPYGSTFATLLMRRSFVDVSATLSGQSANEIVVNPDETMRGNITWTNNLPDKLLNAEVTVKISGNALDQATVSAGKGAYRSLDDTISWTRQHEPALAIIEPGSIGQVDFDFSTLENSALNSLLVRNPYLQIAITFKAVRVVEGSPGEEVKTTLTKLIRVNSQLGLQATALYTGGAFVNSGPMPPKANQETTYTIKWAITNSSNEVDGVTVRGTLPSHARFLNNISPSDANIHYDSSTGVVTWLAGRLPALPGSSPVREAAFQISLLPSVPQIGQNITLVVNMSIAGRDLFTGGQLSDTAQPIDTRIDTDQNFQEIWSRVSQ